MGTNRIFSFLKSKAVNPSSGKALVFLICLILSSFLWLLNSLEKRYTDRISVPVKYVNFPKDKQLAGALPKKLDLMVDGYGYTLLSHKLRLTFSPVILSVSDLTDNVLENSKISKYIINTSSHKEEIEKQISSEIKILTIRPDTIAFTFSTITEKKIKIKPHLQLTFSKDFILQASPSTIPDSVLVRGPKDILDTLHFVYTKNTFYKDLTHHVEESIQLQPSEGLTYAQKRVTLFIPVEQNTEVAFDVPVEVINRPDSIQIKTFPGKVKVNCRIGLSNYKKLNQSSFKAVVDFSKLSGSVNRLPVALVDYPEIVLSVNYAPHEVEYIIENSGR